MILGEFSMRNNGYSSSGDVEAIKRSFRASSLATSLTDAKDVDVDGDVATTVRFFSSLGLDQAPVHRRGKILGWVFIRDVAKSLDISTAMTPLSDSTFVSADTNLGNVIKHLVKAGLVFTVSERGIDGFICVSDLDRHVVRAYFSMLLIQVEMLLAHGVRKNCDEEDARRLLSTNSTVEGQSLRDRYESARNSNDETHAVEYLYLNQLIALFRQYTKAKQMSVRPQVFADLNAVEANRNYIAHAVRTKSGREGARDLHVLDESFSRLTEALPNYVS